MKKNPEMEAVLTTRCTRALKDKLMCYCVSLNVDMADIIRRAVEEYMLRNPDSYTVTALKLAPSKSDIASQQAKTFTEQALKLAKKRPRKPGANPPQ